MLNPKLDNIRKAFKGIKFGPDWYCKGGRLIEDHGHYTYWNYQDAIYVKDGSLERAEKPHFLDIGLMGSCKNDCPHCYMIPRRCESNMDSELLSKILIDASSHLVQVSFGGAGDPFDYDSIGILAEHLYLLREKNIAANITTRAVKRDRNMDHFSAQFTAVGLSFPDRGSPNAMVEFYALMDLIEKQQGSDARLNHLTLHITTNDMIQSRDSFLTLLFKHGTSIPYSILILASKDIPGDRDGIFAYDEQDRVIETIKAIRTLTNVQIGVDACLLPYLPPDLIDSAVALDSCDAGLFSAYITPKGKWSVCSADMRENEAFDGLVFNLDRSCPALSVSSRIKRYTHPKEDVIVKLGYMTNSSSASYFTIVPSDASLKLPIYPIEWRRKRDSYNFYSENNRLVECDLDDWASYAALTIMRAPKPHRKKEKAALDTITRELASKKCRLFYLVADRDDGAGLNWKSSYSPDDVSDDDILLVRCGEEH